MFSSHNLWFMLFSKEYRVSLGTQSQSTVATNSIFLAYIFLLIKLLLAIQASVYAFFLIGKLEPMFKSLFY